MIVLMSLWRNDADADANLEARVEHLLAKTSSYHDVRWLWITGDNDDETYERLMAACDGSQDVTIVHADTNIVGEDTVTRRRRGSETATEMFRFVKDSDTHAVLHESDLITDANVLDQLLLANSGGPVAGWPTIEIEPGKPQFYDVWAYRDLHRRMWSPRQPKGRTRLMEVSSFGSVWLVPAAMIRGRVIVNLAVVELCRQWRDEGIRLYVDSSITVEQPVNLWESC